MRIRKLEYQDFATLRMPLESGRQSPSSLGGALILSLFCQPLIFYCIYYVAATYSNYPGIEQIKRIHLPITALLCLLSLIFAIPPVYKKWENLQYLVLILVSQNVFGLCVYLGGLFEVGNGEGTTSSSLLTFTWITLLIGAALFLFTVIKFRILLQRGHYRTGGKKERMRMKFETSSYIPTAIIGSLGLFYIIQYSIRYTGIADAEQLMIIVLCFAVFYTILFVLPEQIVILYCKFRFKAFTFDRNGYLHSESDLPEDQKETLPPQIKKQTRGSLYNKKIKSR
ncbi:ABC transporter ATPase [Peribacillus sp. SCS-26]|uniref:ABC transporter ATPase n=1 Tax=Paraperibacillus marinus TaxID=3115295 RepID=UPI0039062E30